MSRSKTRRWLLTFLFLSAALPLRLIAEGPRAAVEVNVVDEKTGKFFKDAKVTGTFEDESGAKTNLPEKMTDVRGVYETFASQNGRFALSVSAEGYAPETVEFEIKGTDVKVSRRHRKRIVLKKPAPAAKVRNAEAPPVAPPAQAVPDAAAAPGKPAAVPATAAVKEKPAVESAGGVMNSTEVLAGTGLKESDLRESLFNAIFFDSIQLGWAREKISSAAPALQESFLRGLLQMIRAYVSSDAFAADYLLKRKEWYRLEKESEDEKYPISAAALIRNKLKGFLEESAAVDFAAKTEERYGRIVFVDAENEKRSNLWKKCFRAGPLLTRTARAFAEEWLASLSK